MKIKLLSVVALATISFTTNAQNTFDDVRALFIANCNTNGCHNSNNNAGNLDLSLSAAAIYNQLVNVAPTNPAAVTAGYKRVWPGDPHRSFLFRKCNQGLDPDMTLPQNEGAAMPKNLPALAANERELIRQWIMFGAPQTGVVVDTAVINTFYRGKGIVGNVVAPPPAPAGAFQVHLGRMFLPPVSETEYFIKYKLNLADTVKVNRVDLKMPTESHHFIIYKFLPGGAALFPEGLRLNSSGNYVSFTNAWQQTYDLQLPPSTAYLYEKNAILDLNFHFKNINTDSVLAADVYFDVYTQSKNTPGEIMYSDLIANYVIPIPNDNLDHTCSQSDVDFAHNNWRNWNVWMLTSHTHKYGKDFDIFLRNANGTDGQQIYEGFYDTDYIFNQGFYDWQHPPIKKFENPFQVVNPWNGLIQRATFRNYGNAPVSFGLTTDDEMMLYYIQYTLGDGITGLTEMDKKYSFKAYPNPFADEFEINYSLENEGKVSIELYTILGEKVIGVVEENQSKGSHNYKLNTSQYSNGVYMLKVTVGDDLFVKRLLKAN